MKSLVVLFALAAVVCGSYIPAAQPPHHPAVVLDPHGRPLDTAEVIGARALHLQAKALEGYHYAPLAHTVLAPAVYAAPAAYSHQAYGLGHGHWLKKRSLGHFGYSAHAALIPAAVSHQSRVDLVSSPAVVSHAVAAPVLEHAIAPAAVSHQSRVDVHSSPAVVAHAAVAPLAYNVGHYAPLAYSTGLVHSAPLYHSGAWAHGW